MGCNRRLHAPLAAGQRSAPGCGSVMHPAHHPPAPPRSFAYVMMQRWLDAAKCFNFILGYISK